MEEGIELTIHKDFQRKNKAYDVTSIPICLMTSAPYLTKPKSPTATAFSLSLPLFFLFGGC